MRIPHIESTMREPLLASKYCSSFSSASRVLEMLWRVKVEGLLGGGLISVQETTVTRK